MSQPDRDHGNEHGHVHTESIPSAGFSYYEIMETAVRELLVERKLIAAGEIRRQIEVLDRSLAATVLQSLFSPTRQARQSRL
jgi:hypothetical protein